MYFQCSGALISTISRKWSLRVMYIFYVKFSEVLCFKICDEIFFSLNISLSYSHVIISIHFKPSVILHYFTLVHFIPRNIFQQKKRCSYIFKIKRILDVKNILGDYYAFHLMTHFFHHFRNLSWNSLLY